jgi:hypothetical protein
MSEEEEDLDLQALQRQLDDAFQTTRPRPAFEDELWLRMQSRRPIWSRIRDGFAGLIDGVREAPALPSAAVAIALIVVVGAGIISLNGLHPSGSASTAAGPNAARSGIVAPIGLPGAYGTLPVPDLAAGPTVAGGALTQASFLPGSPNPVYIGPATFTWSGALDVTAASLPVFRYQEPTPAVAARFAISVGATLPAQAVEGGLGLYSGAGFTVVVIGSVAQSPREPFFNLSDQKASPASPGSDPVAIATAYLASHHLLPTWPYQTDVQATGTTVVVRFLRSFNLQAQGQAAVVNSVGDRYGIEVDIPSGTPGAFAAGPLPLTLDSVDYPVITADQAVRSALATSASGGGGTYPAVQLTKAELVYKLVLSGNQGFYEPAFLFSGTFSYHGATYTKRVLVPAVYPSFLAP